MSAENYTLEQALANHHRAKAIIEQHQVWLEKHHRGEYFALAFEDNPAGKSSFYFASSKEEAETIARERIQAPAYIGGVGVSAGTRLATPFPRG